MSEITAKGWCPGALAPMLSGDGYIFRLRLTNGVLSFERAKTFSRLARRFGNGAFDLSARANLQMRGVGAQNIAPLQRELSALGLLDPDARAEAVRNIVPSPLAGFDPTAVIDARPLVVALEALLLREKALHDLPAKFGFSVDGGGALPLAGVVTDVDFKAVSGGAAPRLRIALGGVEAGWAAPENIGAAAEILARNFLDLRQNDRRMSALVARLGVEPLLEGSSAVIARSADDESIDAAAGAREGEAAPFRKILGAQNCGKQNFTGAGLLFGRIDADALEALAEAARESGAAELRLTPWRALLAVGLSSQSARALAARLEKNGFILDAGDPRLVFSACPGAPACPSALGDVRALALALAPHWRSGSGRVHVSGCAKGCALNARAVTLVAGEGGFSLVPNGFARDEPVARGLDLAACQQELHRISAGARV
ncbi:precorrin-3B synthase [uncultured Rhodoblastus sp.]|uniref:precorrin-3B synthase n=1 Tax=uncultured Rhodoblastus sp. TaxID=543037 RepID=UPI0025EF0EE7|nr:precorrin-3B synthase [uncultured Rhodoblastus sp.]